MKGKKYAFTRQKLFVKDGDCELCGIVKCFPTSLQGLLLTHENTAHILLECTTHMCSKYIPTYTSYIYYV